jgi:hypothetical protein
MAMRLVTVKVPVTITIRADNDVNIEDAVRAMLYSMETEDSRLDVEDTQWGDIEFIDSR